MKLVLDIAAFIVFVVIMLFILECFVRNSVMQHQAESAIMFGYVTIGCTIFIFLSKGLNKKEE